MRIVDSLRWKRELIFTILANRKYFILQRTIKKLTFGDVQVEEITIEDGLHYSGYNSNQIEEAFPIVAVDPVEKV